MSELPAAVLLPPSDAGRRFTGTRTVRLGDVDPHGELRLDAIARFLQDVASDDALDAELPNALGWVVRRTMICIEAPASVNERLRLTTFCTGAGRSWAERRTSIAGDGGGSIEAVSLWVQVDVGTGRPARLGDEFFEVYGPAAEGRTVSSKLSLPSAPGEDEAATTSSWRFRRTDLDQFDHVNNAAQWSVVEQLLAGRDRTGTFELEYLGPVDADVDLQLVATADRAWLLAAGVTRSVFAWSA